MSAPSFTLTNDSITIILAGKPTVVRRGAANFGPLRAAILNEEWDRVPQLLTPAKGIQDWVKGKFTVQGEKILFEGQELPSALTSRINEMCVKGENPTAILKFWERLQKNPSRRSVEQLWPFLQHQGIPLTEDGTFFAYKGVREDFKDCHSGQFDNSPGMVHSMPRNQISDDPNEACHVGFHVGALEYARSFGPRVVICEVDPQDVVCIPYDHSAQKMRVCMYKVVGLHNGNHLSSTYFEKSEDEALNDPQEQAENEDFEEAYLSLPVESDQDLRGVAEGEKPAPAATKVVKKHKYDGLGASQLLELTLEELRQYAGKHLKIVGASKVPGGKVALVSLIISLRS